MKFVDNLPRGVKMHKDSGFSIMEIMVVMAIAAVLAAIAVPNLISRRPYHVLQSTISDIQGSIQLARTTAIKERSDVVLIFNAAKDEFQVFVDNGIGGGSDGNGVQDGGERTLRFKRIAAGISIDGVDPSIATSISFNSRGLMNSGSITEIDLGNSQGEAKTIKISLAGISKIE